MPQVPAVGDQPDPDHEGKRQEPGGENLWRSEPREDCQKRARDRQRGAIGRIGRLRIEDDDRRNNAYQPDGATISTITCGARLRAATAARR